MREAGSGSGSSVCWEAWGGALLTRLARPGAQGLQNRVWFLQGCPSLV